MSPNLMYRAEACY